MHRPLAYYGVVDQVHVTNTHQLKCNRKEREGEKLRLNWQYTLATTCTCSYKLGTLIVGTAMREEEGTHKPGH